MAHVSPFKIDFKDSYIFKQKKKKKKKKKPHLGVLCA